MNSKAYLKLAVERQRLEELVTPYDDLIQSLKEDAKKLKKGSVERQDLFKRVSAIQNDQVYKDLKLQIKTMNFCINTAFYS